ncbi:MAG: ABC transporter ATP-binding protein [Blastocatellia bacterium]
MEVKSEPRGSIELRGITKAFGRVIANDHVDLTIPGRSIHAIVGENGAGKSTVMKILYGFYQADQGEIWIDGARREIRTPEDAIALGLGMVHQHFMLVPPMTVLENVMLGAEPGRWWRMDRGAARAKIEALSADFGFHLDLDQRVETLSVGQQQRVELVKALYRGARILILDEPTAVLSPPEVDDFFRILRTMRDQGRTIIIITHKLHEVLAISDEVTVMRDGQVVGRRRTAGTNAAELAQLMVGREVLLTVEKGPATPATPATSATSDGLVLEVEGLGLGTALRDVSFSLRAGEILGIAGVEGNGQTELVEVLAGLTRQDRGSIRFLGKEVGRLSPRRRRELGIAHIPEDRHRRGLLLDFDLTENAILGLHHRRPVIRSGLGVFDRQAIGERVARLLREFDVRPPDASLPARVLSGGNQQKLIIGREFGLPPRLLLVAQPTRGVDIGAIEFIHRQLIALRDRGVAILLVSAELEEVLSLADRVLVMYGGAIVGESGPVEKADLAAPPFRLDEIGFLMTGGSASREAAQGE